MPIDLPESIHDADKYHVCNALIMFGGSFFKKLGSALQSADMRNYNTVLTTWEDEIQETYNIYRGQYDKINESKSK